MPGNGLRPALYSVLLAVQASVFGSPRVFQFKMYRNPAKPLLALVPVQSPRLDRPSRALFDQALAQGAAGLSACKIAPLPDEARLDSLGRLPPEELPILHDKYHIDRILQSRIDHADDRNALSLEIIDTRSGGLLAGFHQECRCQLGELIGWMIPEAIGKLDFMLKESPPTCRGDMALVPAPVKAGEPDSTGNAWGPGAFCIDLYEYPNGVGAGPVTEKSWDEAKAICEDDGKRLCNEEEWELACGGWDRWNYPYGAAYDKAECNTESQTIQLSGGHPMCKSPFGVYDLSGNVYEWTSSPWNPQVPDRVVRGGNWNAGEKNSGCKMRFAHPASEGSKAIGWRCCSEPQR